jgi:hypothetical protein
LPRTCPRAVRFTWIRSSRSRPIKKGFTCQM